MNEKRSIQIRLNDGSGKEIAVLEICSAEAAIDLLHHLSPEEFEAPDGEPNEGVNDFLDDLIDAARFVGWV